MEREDDPQCKINIIVVYFEDNIIINKVYFEDDNKTDQNIIINQIRIE